MKKGIFCRTESIAMMPKSHDLLLPTTSLWGVAAKWPTRAPKMKLILCPRDPFVCELLQPYQFEPVRQDFERVPEHRVSFEANPMRYSLAFAKSHLLKCSPHKIMGVMRHSKKVSSFQLYKLNPLSPHCGSIARELVHCYTWGRLGIVTVRGNTVGRHS